MRFALLAVVVAVSAGAVLLAVVALSAGVMLLAGMALPAGVMLLAVIAMAVLRGLRSGPLGHRGAALLAQVAVVMLHAGDDLRHVGNMCRAQPHRVRRACGPLLLRAHLFCRPRAHSERQCQNQRTSHDAKLACPP